MPIWKALVTTKGTTIQKYNVRTKPKQVMRMRGENSYKERASLITSAISFTLTYKIQLATPSRAGDTGTKPRHHSPPLAPRPLRWLS